MSDSVLVLQGIRRVLKQGPAYRAYGHPIQSTWGRNAKMLKFIGFGIYSNWLPEEYVVLIGGIDQAVEETRQPMLPNLCLSCPG